jgi:hypothetical protein
MRRLLLSVFSAASLAILAMGCHHTCGLCDCDTIDHCHMRTPWCGCNGGCNSAGHPAIPVVPQATDLPAPVPAPAPAPAERSPRPL